MKLNQATCLSALGLLSLAIKTQATYAPYDYSNEHSPAGSVYANASIYEKTKRPLKFQAWYDHFAPDLVEISHGVCNLSLRAYMGDLDARVTLGPVKGYCWTHTNCLMSSLSERIKASFAATSILLGLAPTTLSVLGPSVGEIALLSCQRPLLSMLLSLGAPAIYPGRFLLWIDPLRANAPQTGTFIVRPFTRHWAIFLSIIEYILVMGACINVLNVAWHIGLLSISSWTCGTSYWPLCWVIMSLGISFLASLSLRTSITRKPNLQRHGSETEGVDANGQSDKWKRPGFVSVLRDEVTLSSNHKWQVRDLFDVRLGPLPLTLQYLGAFISLVHLVFGTVVFSSLLFIGVNEAVFMILRFVASATICRCILQFEIGGMTKVEEQRLYKNVVQGMECEA